MVESGKAKWQVEVVLDDLLVNLIVIVKPRMTLTRVETSREGNGQFADQAVVGNAQVAQLQSKAHKMCNANVVSESRLC